ncbi:MAG: PEP-CTERM sorting domain-containing protein [Phycisphaeraceae bacterium]
MLSNPLAGRVSVVAGAVLVLTHALAAVAAADDRFIAESTTVDGSAAPPGDVLTLDPAAGLFVTHATNDPLLTFTNGATSVGIEGLAIGSLEGESGRLVVEGGSTLTNAGDSTTSLGTVGEVHMRRGEGYLGLNAGASGEALITGDGSAWANTARLFVGYRGAGTLAIEAGASVSNGGGSVGTASGSTGTVRVAGEDATWSNSGGLAVGSWGTGTLLVGAGASVSSTGGSVGGNGGSDGTATVTGVGASWTNSGQLVVGRHGAGALNIDAGARVSSTSGAVGYLHGSHGTVTVAGKGTRWSNSGELTISRSGVGVLKIEDGGRVSTASANVARSSMADATAIVRGADSDGSPSTWTNEHEMYVGDGSSLTVADGGVVVTRSLQASLGDLHGNGTIHAKGVVLDHDLVFDSTHGLQQTIAFGSGGELELDVDGTGALGAGRKGAGSLTIADGITVASTTGLVGAGATVTVTGGGSTWTNSGSLRVDPGTFTIEAGGSVNNGDALVAGGFDGPSATVTVTGPETRWTNNGSLKVGGALMIAAGGSVLSTEGHIADQRLIDGAVILTGAGASWTNTGPLTVGGYGRATLTIESGGSVANTVGYIGRLHPFAVATATVSGQSATWNNSQGLYVGGDETSGKGTASLTVSDGGQVIADGPAGLTIWETGTLAGAGGAVIADVTSRGHVAPGDAIGTLTIDGSYDQLEDGLLSIAIDELGHGALDVKGDASLAGGLSVELLADASPTPGQTFEILTADAITGAFDEAGLSLPDTRWSVHYADSTVALTFGHLLGDMNLDGVVDAVDVTPFVLALTDPQAYEVQYDIEPTVVGDVNGDGVLDAVDVGPFVQLLVGGDRVSSVPEPGSLGLLGLGGLMLLRRR